jgi:Potential Queuosine, Q, salvage protein family
MLLPDRVRAGCGWVAGRAQSVQIDKASIVPYAAKLPVLADVPGLDPTAHYLEGAPQAVTAFVLCLDAINFGSGWWPTVRKRPGRSGYLTMASGLADRFRVRGPWSANELMRIQIEEIAAVLGQDPGHDLMPLFAWALRDLCRPSSSRRGQFFDLHQLTAFADNLVPHVLALDGVLVLAPVLAARIAAGELLVHDSPEEVELRACALHAVELLAAAIHHRLSPAQIDMVLWSRGQEPRYKAHPRPHARTTAY